jgi:protocatechuate 3,4-dioxygenase beta subunit
VSHTTGNRRQFLAMSAAVSGATWSGATSALAQAGLLQPTVSCDDQPTPRQTEGPFYTPRSPRRQLLRESGIQGAPFTLVGVVLTRSCRPVSNALVDLWQADARGEYDNNGFKLRGHQYTDEAGRYRFESVIPGAYSGRTRHLHLKFQPSGGRVLTTQFYFPEEPANSRDQLFTPKLVMSLRQGSNLVGTFITILDV